MEKVSWKVKGLFNADAQKCYEEIGDGKVTPAAILDVARDENTELHKCFCWDDTEAAEKYRLLQAGNIVRNLVITPIVEDEQPIRVYQITSEKNHYQPTRFFLEQPDEYKGLLDRAIRELNSFKRKYENLAELELVFKAIEEL